MKTLHKLPVKEKILNDFYVFDVETKGLRARPDAFIFGIVYGFEYTKVIYTIEDFHREFMSKRYYKKKVFAHNAEYDLSVIYDNIYQFDKNAIFNNNFICATNGNCMFADSFNIYRSSVKNIGDIINLKKLDIENEYIDGKEVKEVTQKMIDYCIRDCEIIYKALFEIFQRVGNIKITIAGLSMEYYRRFFQPFHIDYNDVLGSYFQNSYYGGRTECFYIGEVDANVIDINSMYPYAMKNETFPNPKMLKKIDHMTPERFTDYYLKYYEGCADVELFHVEHFFGHLPVRHNKKLVFPTGSLSGTWNFNEIRYALAKNVIKIKNVKNVIYSEKMKSPFIKFVDEIYTNRKNTDNELEKTIFKLLMNSLYGKFAQKIDRQNIYIENIETEYDIIENYEKEGKLLKIVPFNSQRKDCFIVIKSEKGHLYNSIPLFSSYITSFARTYLLSFLLKYQNKSPVYCDTDSIFFNENVKITESEELGGWKNEKKYVTEIRGLKNYSYISDNKKIEKIKGVPKRAEKTGKNSYRYASMVRTKEGLRRNIDTGIWIERNKSLTNIYEKRKVNNDGTTEPLHFQT